jgi:hypothetical protein
MKERNNWMKVLGLVAICVYVLFVLLPMLARRHKPGYSNCQTNLKQLALGIAQYYDDQDPNRMPPMASVQALATNIAPYIGSSTRLFVCPGDKTLEPAAKISNQTESSYAWIPTAVWQDTNQVILAFDKLQPSGLTVLTGSNSWSRQSAHRGDGGCVLFTDGHIEWMRVLDVGTNRYPVVND